MYELWHRVAIFRALEALGWRAVPPALAPASPYGIGETHHFVRGERLLRLDIVVPAGSRRLEEAVATVGRGEVWPEGSSAFRLHLERTESVRWREALRKWAELASAAAAPNDR